MANSNVNFLQTASIIPYLPAMDIQFIAADLMPERDVYFFFDGEDIHSYIQPPNQIFLSGSPKYRDLLSNRRAPTLTSGSNTVDVIDCSRSDVTGNTLLYVTNVTGKFVVGATITDGTTAGTITDYIHKSGECSGTGTSNTVILANDSVVMANNYWGTGGANTIFITSGPGIRQYGNITAFNNVTKALTVSGTPFTTVANTLTRYAIGQPDGGHDVDVYGIVRGTFNLPSDSTLKFKTGERLFKITDSPRNLDEEAESAAGEMFYGVGMNQTASEIGDPDKTKKIIRTIIKIIDPPTEPPDNPPHTPPNLEGGNDGGRDPLAQTFNIPVDQYPNGCYLTSVDLFFQSVDANNIPVSIELRPVVNGFPSSSRVYENSIVRKRPDECNVSSIPSVSNASTATTFTFPSPVYVKPGEHALVVMTKSRDYRVYISQLGQTIIGGTNKVSKQPHMGSLFKSQNATAWTPFQFEDLMFVMRRAKFERTGSVVFKNRFETKKGDEAAAVDLMFPRTRAQVLPNTTVAYEHSIDGGSNFASFRPNRYYKPSSRFHIDSKGDYQIEMTLETSDNAVSPMVVVDQQKTIAIQKLINNGNISNVHISITNGGSGYPALANIKLGFDNNTAGNTSPVVGFALANAAGSIDDVLITDGGARFTADMNVYLANAVSGSGATFNFLSEVDARGGPVQCKYISRIVTLKEGFDGGDLRLFITANKPSGTQIKCYYKIRNNQDPEPFDRKSYYEFEQITPATKVSADEKEIIEYEFRPDADSDEVSYTTSAGVSYSTFHQYSVKIVLLSTNTTKNPVVYDMRCIALPGNPVDDS
jgi:hypothetical protein